MGETYFVAAYDYQWKIMYVRLQDDKSTCIINTLIPRTRTHPYTGVYFSEEPLDWSD